MEVMEIKLKINKEGVVVVVKNKINENKIK